MDPSPRSESGGFPPSFSSPLHQPPPTISAESPRSDFVSHPGNINFSIYSNLNSNSSSNNNQASSSRPNNNSNRSNSNFPNGDNRSVTNGSFSNNNISASSQVAHLVEPQTMRIEAPQSQHQAPPSPPNHRDNNGIAFQHVSDVDSQNGRLYQSFPAPPKISRRPDASTPQQQQQQQQTHQQQAPASQRPAGGIVEFESTPGRRSSKPSIQQQQPVMTLHELDSAPRMGSQRTMPLAESSLYEHETTPRMRSQSSKSVTIVEPSLYEHETAPGMRSQSGRGMAIVEPTLMEHETAPGMRSQSGRGMAIIEPTLMEHETAPGMRSQSGRGNAAMFEHVLIEHDSVPANRASLRRQQPPSFLLEHESFPANRSRRDITNATPSALPEFENVPSQKPKPPKLPTPAIAEFENLEPTKRYSPPPASARTPIQPLPIAEYRADTVIRVPMYERSSRPVLELMSRPATLIAAPGVNNDAEGFHPVMQELPMFIEPRSTIIQPPQPPPSSQPSPLITSSTFIPRAQPSSYQILRPSPRVEYSDETANNFVNYTLNDVAPNVSTRSITQSVVLPAAPQYVSTLSQHVPQSAASYSPTSIISTTQHIPILSSSSSSSPPSYPTAQYTSMPAAQQPFAQNQLPASSFFSITTPPIKYETLFSVPTPANIRLPSPPPTPKPVPLPVKRAPSPVLDSRFQRELDALLLPDPRDPLPYPKELRYSEMAAITSETVQNWLHDFPEFDMPPPPLWQGPPLASDSILRRPEYQKTTAPLLSPSLPKLSPPKPAFTSPPRTAADISNVSRVRRREEPPQKKIEILEPYVDTMTQGQRMQQQQHQQIMQTTSFNGVRGGSAGLTLASSMAVAKEQAVNMNTSLAASTSIASGEQQYQPQHYQPFQPQQLQQQQWSPPKVRGGSQGFGL